ncbi:glycerate kinase [Isoptericola sp. BMS4]|uniref:glycerate kinase n=1 Tax=Isoptericola sp. BMS4 TaxID=2527875 RepID=UPI001423ACFF|nr:glycerate kinase [Isoptericola sp. BMS4]
MHVLICAPPAAPVAPGEPGASSAPEGAPPSVRPPRAASLAAAWQDAAPHCTVEPLELDGPAPGGPPDPEAPRGVFVPVTSLGLDSAREHLSPRAARLREHVSGADLVVVAAEALDGATLHEGPVAAVADAAAPYAVPVVVVADRVEVTRREWSAAGVSGVHEAATSGEALARVARTWAPAWSASSR